MDISSLLKTTLVIWMTRAWFYRMIVFLCIILFTCPICKKNWNIFPNKNKSIFSNPKIFLVQLKEGFRVSSVKAYSNWWSQTPDHGCKLVRDYNILLFNNAFMISPMIILTVILSSNFSSFGFKFETGIRVTIYYLLPHNLVLITYHLLRRMLAKNDSVNLFT